MAFCERLYSTKVGEHPVLFNPRRYIYLVNISPVR